jgi:hypothetical protein
MGYGRERQHEHAKRGTKNQRAKASESTHSPGPRRLSLSQPFEKVKGHVGLVLQERQNRQVDDQQRKHDDHHSLLMVVQTTPETPNATNVTGSSIPAAISKLGTGLPPWSALIDAAINQ